MLRHWFAEHRAFLAAAPVALVLGLAWPGWQAWHGNDGSATDPIDVAKGEVAHYAGADFKLKNLKVEASKSHLEQSAPEKAVSVVVTYRGRIPNKKTEKDLFCYFQVENADGWQWGSDSSISAGAYVSKHLSDQCNGKTLNDKFKDVYPKPGTWFDFVVAFTVPKSRAVGLRPTLAYSKEYPHYLRFER